MEEDKSKMQFHSGSFREREIERLQPFVFKNQEWEHLTLSGKYNQQ